MKTITICSPVTQALQMLLVVIGVLLCVRVLADDPRKDNILKCVTAEKFILVDRNGRERGVWEATEKSATIMFIDDTGKDWVRISATMEDDGMANISVGPDDGRHCFVYVSSFGPIASVGVFDKVDKGQSDNRP